MHHYDTDQMGHAADEWWCSECHREAPCDTMRLASAGKEPVLALHRQGKYLKKIRDGWFKHHLELRYFCYADMQAWPCRTVSMLGEA
jgi:hypothetical protein